MKEPLRVKDVIAFLQKQDPEAYFREKIDCGSAMKKFFKSKMFKADIARMEDDRRRGISYGGYTEKQLDRVAALLKPRVKKS